MLLRKDDPWLKELSVPDIRDWRVVDANGRTVGFVQSLAIDRDKMRVEALLTGANDRYAADDFEIDDGVVRIKHSLEERATADERNVSQAPSGFDAAFRGHFDRVYGVEAAEYSDFRPAYRFGRVMALDADYSSREFSRAEEDLRAEYLSRGLYPPFEAVRVAVRFGYDLAQNLHRYEEAGMGREGKQIIGKDDPSAKRSARAGSAMDTGSPPEEDKSVLNDV